MKLLSLARDLRRRKARHRAGRFVAEGVRTVEALLDSPLVVTGLLATSALRLDVRGGALFDRAMARELPVQDVTDSELSSASDTETPQGVLAIAEIPQRALPTASTPSRFLLLDGVQDPGNVGTMIRTAAALGAHATIALPGTVDLWNAKVVRSTMGAIFAHHALAAPWEDVGPWMGSTGVTLWTADAGGNDVGAISGNVIPARLALCVGNEGAGISVPVREASERSVAVPIDPSVESLNVAIATGILLHALRPT